MLQLQCGLATWLHQNWNRYALVAFFTSFATMHFLSLVELPKVLKLDLSVTKYMFSLTTQNPVNLHWLGSWYQWLVVLNWLSHSVCEGFTPLQVQCSSDFLCRSLPPTPGRFNSGLSESSHGHGPAVLTLWSAGAGRVSTVTLHFRCNG